MNVALLYPEVYDMARFKQRRKEFPPFGVLYLAAAIERAGHCVSIEKVTPGRTKLDLSVYDAVGFSLASSATVGYMLEVRRTSVFKRNLLIMVGGIHCNFFPHETMRLFDADVGAAGESEELILQILDRAVSRDFRGVRGALWRDKWGVHQEETRPLMVDIDRLPPPARHLLDVDDVVMSNRLAGTDTRMSHVMFSRGCPFPCSFCAVAQTKIQYRGGESARSELTHLIENYGIQGFAITDDNFVVAKKKVAEICASIGDLGLRWSALSRVDTVDSELLHTMFKAGCIEIKYGMESGSESLLEAMRKNTTRAEIASAIRATVAAGIEAKVFLIHGFPGETLETTYETMSLLDELGASISRVSLFRFVPLPGTQVYNEAEKFGVRGTHRQAEWDGDWAKFHIHHNEHHWWGSPEDWQETETSYRMLKSFIEDRWNAQGDDDAPATSEESEPTGEQTLVP